MRSRCFVLASILFLSGCLSAADRQEPSTPQNSIGDGLGSGTDDRLVFDFTDNLTLSKTACTPVVCIGNTPVEQPTFRSVEFKLKRPVVSAEATLEWASSSPATSELVLAVLDEDDHELSRIQGASPIAIVFESAAPDMLKLKLALMSTSRVGADDETYVAAETPQEFRLWGAIALQLANEV